MINKDRRVLLDLADYPVGDDVIGGIGLRAVEFSDVLADRFATTLLTTNGEKDRSPLIRDDIEMISKDDWRRAVSESDVCLFFDEADQQHVEFAYNSGKGVVSEAAPPIEHLEYPSVTSARGSRQLRRIQDAFRSQLAHSHLLIARCAQERLSLVSALATLGLLSSGDVRFNRRIEHRLKTVPIGFSRRALDQSQAAGQECLAHVLWTGGLWRYLDPASVAEALPLVRNANEPSIRLAYIYGQRTEDNADTIDHLQARREKTTDSIELIEAPLLHSQRDAIINGCKVLVCIGRPGLENETCVRLRIRDSRLYCKPLVVDSHGYTAEVVKAESLGVVAESNGPSDIARALTIAFEEFSRICSSIKAQQQRWTYELTLAPVLEWIEKSSWV